MRIERKWLNVISMAYIYIPVCLFLMGWTRLLFAAVSIAVCAFCFCCFCWRDETDRGLQEKITVDWVVLIFAILLFAWIGYCSGYGRFVNQSSDWRKHNAILQDLVQRDWPVLYFNNGEKSMLTYYIGQYLVPAAIGKALSSVRVAEVVLYIWNVLGLVLVFLNILIFTKAGTFLKQLVFAWMIPFFSIPLWLSQVLLQMVSEFDTLGAGQWFYYADEIMIQYSNNYTLLRWVFPQTIPIWLMVVVFLLNKEKIRHYVFVLLPALLFGTITFVGILPLTVGAAVENIFKTQKTKEWLKQIFSAENIFMSLTLGMIVLFYFLGNVTGEKPEEIGFSVMQYTKETIVIYVCFVMINILPYAILLLKRHKSDLIYYVSILSLFILPFFKMGMYNDLVMRASIPALFVLMIYVVQNLFVRVENYSESIGARISLLATIVLLMIGMHYPYMELTRSLKAEDYKVLGTGNDWDTLEWFADRSLEAVGVDVKYNYYSYDIDENFFCKHIMKRNGKSL